MKETVYPMADDPGEMVKCPECKQIARSSGPRFIHMEYRAEGGLMRIWRKRFKCASRCVPGKWTSQFSVEWKEGPS